MTSDAAATLIPTPKGRDFSMSNSVPEDGVLQQFNNSDFAFGRVVVPVPNLNKPPQKGKLGVEYMEHSYIGDSIELILVDGGPVAASSHKFQLPNGLALTYGQINALAGDFYGTHHPISDGKSSQDRSTRFLAAYNTLANGGPRQPEEANKILSVLQAEIDAVNDALINHQDPSVVYSTLPDVTCTLEQITSGRSDIPSYIGLAKINWDHFGEDARMVYNVGHSMAIQKAIDGDLEGAYALNAFADHFLEDSFSSGHLRTPRRLLHGAPGLSADVCAKLMHDEDCAVGLRVENPVGESWECYGDKRALNEVAAENLKRCVAAVQTSADEIYTAYLTKRAPPPSIYAAWGIAPTLESARSPGQALTTLFTSDWRRRRDIKARKTWTFGMYPPFVTALECKSSGYWNPPITIDGAHSAIPWSGISAATSGNWLLRVFHQTPSGAIIQTVWHSRWTRTHRDQPLVNAVLFTPLASITWNNGTEVRLYYLDPEYILQEHCYSEGRGWFAGEIGQLNLKTSVNTRIAAFRHDFDGSDHIRVYCQEAGSRAIIELCKDHHWTRGSRLPDALDGTSISAVVYHDGTQVQYRVYYQAEDLSLREHCFSHDEKGWFPGKWNPCKAPGRSPINAAAYPINGHQHLHVYWRNGQDEIVTNNTESGWGPATKVVGGVASGFQFALVWWEQGRYIRIYYQNRAGALPEHCSDDGGGAWCPGAQLGDVTQQA